MLGQPVFSLVMMTIALAVFIKSVVALVWGNYPHRFPGTETSSPIELAGIYIQPLQLVLLAVYAAICARRLGVPALQHPRHRHAGRRK